MEDGSYQRRTIGGEEGAGTQGGGEVRGSERWTDRRMERSDSTHSLPSTNITNNLSLVAWLLAHRRYEENIEVMKA